MICSQVDNAAGSKRSHDVNDAGGKRMKTDAAPEVKAGEVDKIMHNVLQYQLQEPLKAMMESSQGTENISQVRHNPKHIMLICLIT